MNTVTKNKGFTLIETLVAISVLVTALVAPLTLASQSLFAAVYAKDQITGFYLAQEAIELIREKRDNNLLAIVNGGTIDWLQGISTTNNLLVDVKNDTISNCSGSCFNTPLKYDGTFYTYTTGTDTSFSRSVKVTRDANNPNEAVVVATVQWRTGTFKKRNIEIKERLYNWVPSN